MIMNQEMEYVYAVYKEGSISKAAEKLFITQPALSIAIKRVEQKYGETLFDRSRVPLCLTPVGEVYIQKYHAIKALERELQSQISDIHHLQKGDLVIGGSNFIIAYVLAPVLSYFSEIYPNITIKLLECRSDMTEDYLLDGVIDLCLRHSECPPTLRRIKTAFSDLLLVAVPLSYINHYKLPDKWINLEEVMNNEHLNDNCPSVNFNELAEMPFVLLTKENNVRKLFSDLVNTHGISPIKKMEVEQLATSYYLADSGLGATLASTIMIKKCLSRNLVFFKINDSSLIRQFYFVGRGKGYISKVAAKFMELLRGHYPSNPS